MASSRTLFTRPLTWIVLAVGLLLLGGCLARRAIGWTLLNAEIHHKFPDVPRLRINALAVWLNDPHRTRPVLLDVREPVEFNVSHLAHARQVNPDAAPSSLNLPKDTPIVTYCSVGYRSAIFAQRLRQAGYTDVQNLEGSIFQWANEGHPVQENGVRVAKVHPYNQTWGLLLKPALRANVPPADQPHPSSPR